MLIVEIITIIELAQYKSQMQHLLVRVNSCYAFYLFPAIIGQQARPFFLWFLWQDQTSRHNLGKCLGNSQTSWSQAFPNIKGNDRKSTMYIFAMRFYFVKGHCTVEVAMNYQTIWIVKVWLLLGQCTSTIHCKAEAAASIESKGVLKGFRGLAKINSYVSQNNMDGTMFAVIFLLGQFKCPNQ